MCEFEKKGAASAGSERNGIAPKIEAHEMPALLTIEVKSGVDKEDGEKMRQGFKVMDFYLNEWLGHSITEKSAIRIEAASEDSKFLKENGTFVFYWRTFSSDWLPTKQNMIKYNIDERTKAAAHEYVHIYQINKGCAKPLRMGENPRWFLEGEAEWLSYKAVYEAGISPYPSSLKQYLLYPVRQAGATLKPLQMYEKESHPGAEYFYFTLALDLLMKNRDIKTLDDFCANIGKGQDVPVAFQNAFGISLDKFYEEFEAYRKTW